MNAKIIDSAAKVAKFVWEHKGKILMGGAAIAAWIRDRKKQYLKGRSKGQKEGFNQASKEWAKKFQELENKYKHTAKTIRALNDIMREYIGHKERCTSEFEKQLCDQRIKEIQEQIDDLT